jgi:ABC-type transport system involved in multi-copper enzyme maturation permease subunit
MTPTPNALRTIQWMVHDTFRQSIASKLLWVMLGLTILCTVFCFGISVNGDDEPPRHPDQLPTYMPRSQDTPEVRAEGVRVVSGRVALGFGLFQFDISKKRDDSVRLIQLWLAGILADTAGVLLAVLWTAGFLPGFLEPHSVAVLLAKPAPRWSLLVGKYLGVVLFVGLHAVLFVAGTWLGMGFSTNVWDPRYWLAVPLLILNFAIFYAFSSFLAVWTRSTVVCIFGTLLFWLLCWAMNLTRHHLVGFDVQGITPAAAFLVESGYWILPKPLDLSGLFFEIMQAADYSTPIPELVAIKEKGQWYPELSLLTSMTFAGIILGFAAYEFRKTDY